jgi:hypothetical protein
MYERFTDRARKVMQLANQEAQRLNHECIGTGHILLGLVKEGFGVGARVLREQGIQLDAIRKRVEETTGLGGVVITPGKLPLTELAKKVIEYSIEEARNLNHNYVGTEHLLLGLLREQEGVAAQVLMNLGLKPEDAREDTVRLLVPISGLGALIQSRKRHFRRLGRQFWTAFREYRNLTVFIGGVGATVSSAYMVGSVAAEYQINAGALVGGVIYVLAVALGYLAAQHRPKLRA